MERRTSACGANVTCTRQSGYVQGYGAQLGGKRVQYFFLKVICKIVRRVFIYLGFIFSHILRQP